LLVVSAKEARAQTSGSFSLDQFQPAPAGDDFFAVQGYRTGEGTVDYSALVLGEYARNPLVLYNLNSAGKTDTKAGSVISDQLFLHVGGSVSFFERAQVSLDFPFALLNKGGSDLSGSAQSFNAPTGAALGDLRAGLRLRLIGDKMSPFGAAITGYIWFPTGDESKFTGDGSVRGSPGLSVGGRIGFFIYGLNGGALIRKGADVANTHMGTSFTFGGAAGVLLLEDKLQLSAETYGGTVVAKADSSSQIGAFDRKNTNLEALLGVKGRLGPIVLGAGAGPGFTSGPGTPAVRAVLSIAYVPEHVTEEPKPTPAQDRDQDGILDKDDACPDDKGKKTDDPKTNGCPDTDGDGIFDKDDACKDVPGVADPDPKKNGCPPPSDRDKDTILDEVDACPDVAGVADSDPAKNGCPPDKDGDGIFDKDDACPDVKGVANADPAKNGCPPDTDGDGITDDKDACPNEPGKPDPDPAKNGCPTVFVHEGKIEILEQVQFKTGSDVILAASDELLTNVAAVFAKHPEITKVLVEGHTDNKGGKAYNKNLSNRRAASVRKWLVKHGVDDKRLDSKGFGQDRPIGDNGTDEGRQKNRRVEFKILETTKPAGVQPAGGADAKAGDGADKKTPPPKEPAKP
jgi:outer membrane protein OmpA-like peptidoglycan-associated protein